MLSYLRMLLVSQRGTDAKEEGSKAHSTDADSCGPITCASAATPSSSTGCVAHELLLASTASDGCRTVESEKQAFLEAGGKYNAAVDAVRAQEFSRLQNHVYLDAAGAALYSEQQIEAAAADLRTHLFLNPHRCGTRVWGGVTDTV